MVSQRFRTLGCPPAVGPAKQSKILGPFRRGVSRFRRFAFRVSLSRFRYTQLTVCLAWHEQSSYAAMLNDM